MTPRSSSTRTPRARCESRQNGHRPPRHRKIHSQAGDWHLRAPRYTPEDAEAAASDSSYVSRITHSDHVGPTHCHEPVHCSGAVAAGSKNPQAQDTGAIQAR